MSCFVCGKFVVPEHADDSTIRDELLHLASQRGLVLKTGENQLQPIVHQIVSQGEPINAKDDILFFVADGPNSDVSEGLISPFEIEGDFFGVLERNLRSLAELFKAALDSGGISHIVACISEGFDPSHEDFDATPAEFAALCVQQFRRTREVPTLRVVVSSPRRGILA